MKTKIFLNNFMINKIAIFLLSVLCGISINSVYAQETKTKNRASLNAGAEFAIPTGDLSLVTSFGVGSSVKLIVPTEEHIAFTASVGYLYYTKKTLLGEKFGGFHSFPLKGGFRFSIKQGFYFEPQAGYSIFDSEGESDGAFTYAGNIGYLINKKVDVSARYESATKNGGSLSHVGVSVAYNFKL